MEENNERIIDKRQKLILSSDRENNYNRNFINLQPSGYLIMDSVNNPFFPLDTFKVDDANFNLPRIRKEFHGLYGGNPNDLFLPWHYTVETINRTVYVINTRPWNYKNIIEGYEKRISVMIIGDSNQDIYTMDFYKTIANFIVNPLRFVSSLKMLNQRKDFDFKTGKNFNKEMLFKWIV